MQIFRIKERIFTDDRNYKDFDALPSSHARKVMGSIPVGDSDFFFVPRSCHVI